MHHKSTLMHHNDALMHHYNACTLLVLAPELSTVYSQLCIIIPWTVPLIHRLRSYIRVELWTTTIIGGITFFDVIVA